jgi:DNA-binding SARP family transcriptional activator
MMFGLLGPLTVTTSSGDQLKISSASQRIVLAALLTTANEAIATDDLIDILWPQAPPRSARVTLHNYVKRLRQAIGPEGPTRIRTTAAGYAIKISQQELDISRFTERVAAGRDNMRRGDWATASEHLRTALSLWRGPALMDVPSDPLVSRERPRLDEMRLQALEARIDADLRLGRHAALAAELRRLTVLEPLRERLHIALMIALYRSGQQAAAVSAYRHARQTLVSETGLEPGALIQQLHQKILNSDPGLLDPAADILSAPGLPSCSMCGQPLS